MNGRYERRVDRVRLRADLEQAILNQAQLEHDQPNIPPEILNQLHSIIFTMGQRLGDLDWLAEEERRERQQPNNPDISNQRPAQ